MKYVGYPPGVWVVHLNKTSGARNPRVPARFALAEGLDGIVMRGQGLYGKMKHASYRPSASPRSVPLTLTCRAIPYVRAWQISNVSDLPLIFHVDGPPLVQYADTPSPERRRIRTSVESGQTNDKDRSAPRRTSASPKSTIVPSQVVGLNRKFAGFRSRWMIPRA